MEGSARKVGEEEQEMKSKCVGYLVYSFDKRVLRFGYSVPPKLKPGEILETYPDRDSLKEAVDSLRELWNKGE